MKTSTQVLALLLGASALTAAQAERLDVTLEGTVSKIVSTVYEFNVVESPGGLPYDWGPVGERYPTESESFRLGEAFKIHFAFDTTSNALIDAELRNGTGASWRESDLSHYIMGVDSTTWALGFPIAKVNGDLGGDRFYFGADLHFNPGAYAQPAYFSSADEHLAALPGLKDGSAYLYTDLQCNGPAHPGEEVCTILYADIDKVTFTSSQASVTVAVPEASAGWLALCGLTVTGLWTTRQRRSRSLLRG